MCIKQVQLGVQSVFWGGRAGGSWRSVLRHSTLCPSPLQVRGNVSCVTICMCRRWGSTWITERVLTRRGSVGLVSKCRGCKFWSGGVGAPLTWDHCSQVNPLHGGLLEGSKTCDQQAVRQCDEAECSPRWEKKWGWDPSISLAVLLKLTSFLEPRSPMSRICLFHDE
jgi:hypothetical protein